MCVINGAIVFSYLRTAAAKSLQLCPTLCNPIDGSLPASLVHGIFQAGVLEWVAIAFSKKGGYQHSIYLIAGLMESKQA